MEQTTDRTSTNGAPSDATRVRRVDRGAYDRPTIDAILDEGFIAHVGIVSTDGRPVVLPMLYARDGDHLLLHGSPATRLLRGLKRGIDLCVTVTLLDGLVLARSAFHHSLNFRSVVVLGQAERMDDPDEAARALDRFTDHLIPGRLAGLRPMTDLEVRGTSVLRLALTEASAKVRTGDPVDDDDDLAGDTWAGVLPLHLGVGTPTPAADLRPGIELPAHVATWTRGTSSAR